MKEDQNKNQIQKDKKNSSDLFWCERLKKHLKADEKCNYKGYCPYRESCLLYLRQKFEDF